MKDTLMSRETLLERLRANRESHRETYRRATTAYQDKIVNELQTMIKLVVDGHFHDPYALSRLPVPEDHTEDYDTAIEMLELDTRKEVLLDNRSFRAYIRDEWEWKRNWVANTQRYSDALDEGS